MIKILSLYKYFSTTKNTSLSHFSSPYRIPIRYMHRSGPILRSLTPTMPSSRSYATRSVVRLKGKAANDHANDGTGKHPHITTENVPYPIVKIKYVLQYVGNP